MNRCVVVALVTASLLAGCSGVECDPVSVAERLAGPGAQSCGLADPYGDSDGDALRARRNCSIAAADKGTPFFASVSPPSADGGVERGWAFDGETFYLVTHSFSSGPLGYTESQTYQRCARLELLPADCDSLQQDLCLRCGSPDPAIDACQ